MDIYLVGGAVRDQMLGLPVKDRDWVVVGATPAHLLDKGYTAVGRDFPVFLHPDTHEEYALARQERKTGVGYTGFDCRFDPEVTLEEDLLRRDLTINAMAQGTDGQLVDPYDGANDLKDRLLRHVSPAFAEDPLRVLRVARFYARFSEQGFTVAPETFELLQQMSASDELNHLTPERVWQETVKALTTTQPWCYFELLHDCGALQRIWPELDTLFGVPQVPAYHPEIDTGIHVMMTLQAALRHRNWPQLEAERRLAILFALLCHDLGKGLTPEHKLPSHHGHEALSAHLAEKVCARLKVPKQCQRLALLVAEYHTHAHRALELKPATVMRLLERLDALRRPQTLTDFLLACEADACGRTGWEQKPYPQTEYLLECAKAAQSIQAADLHHLGLRGKAIGTELRQRRIREIGAVKADYVTDTP